MKRSVTKRIISLLLVTVMTFCSIPFTAPSFFWYSAEGNRHTGYVFIEEDIPEDKKSEDDLVNFMEYGTILFLDKEMISPDSHG